MSETSKPDLAEIRRALRDFQKRERLARLAQGRGKPRTWAETEIWMEATRRRLGLGDERDAAAEGRE